MTDHASIFSNQNVNTRRQFITTTIRSACLKSRSSFLRSECTAAAKAVPVKAAIPLQMLNSNSAKNHLRRRHRQPHQCCLLSHFRTHAMVNSNSKNSPLMEAQFHLYEKRRIVHHIFTSPAFSSHLNFTFLSYMKQEHNEKIATRWYPVSVYSTHRWHYDIEKCEE